MTGTEVDDFIGSVFGDENQLTVLSWGGERCGGNKLYTVRCSVCANDYEMFGKAEFLCKKAHLQRGTYPCGCSKSPKLTQDQMILKIKRACSALGQEYIRIDGLYDKTQTRVVASCPIHGEMQPKSAMDIFTGRGCIECRRSGVKDSLTKPDEYFINRFLATGNFHPDTIFKRSERLTPADKYREGVKLHWKVYCPICDKHVEGHLTSMLCGHSPCACSSYGKVFMYLHDVSDSNISIALKYGVATSPNRRLRDQSKLCIYDITRIRLWRFKDSSDCRAAETEIKRSVPSKFLTKDAMKDGWTETCSPDYREKIEEIVMKFGGKLW